MQAPVYSFSNQRIPLSVGKNSRGLERKGFQEFELWLPPCICSVALDMCPERSEFHDLVLFVSFSPSPPISFLNPVFLTVMFSHPIVCSKLPGDA